MNPKVIALAKAISVAEGFGPSENLPTRCNNPGDLELGDIGEGTSDRKTIFPTAQDGWDALEEQCEMMLEGTSHIYKPWMNFLQVAQLYTGADNSEEWAETVTQELGIGVDTTLLEYYNEADEENVT